VVERVRGPRPLGDPLEHEYLRIRRIRPGEPCGIL
jgi:hypothetical protein